jgi:hypothetical protein
VNSGPAVAGGAVYVDGHYGKVYALKRWVVSISASQCQVLRFGAWLFCSRQRGPDRRVRAAQLESRRNRHHEPPLPGIALPPRANSHTPPNTGSESGSTESVKYRIRSTNRDRGR